MPDLLLAYSSQTGRTRALVEAAHRAAVDSEPGLDILLRRALQTRVEDLIHARAVLLASPENFGYMAGAVKDLLDRGYEPAGDRMRGRAYAILVSAGNDGRGAVASIERIATGFGWVPAVEPLISRGEPSEADLARAGEIGEQLAAGLACGIY